MFWIPYRLGGNVSVPSGSSHCATNSTNGVIYFQLWSFQYLVKTYLIGFASLDLSKEGLLGSCHEMVQKSGIKVQPPVFPDTLSGSKINHSQLICGLESKTQRIWRDLGERKNTNGQIFNISFIKKVIEILEAKSVVIFYAEGWHCIKFKKSSNMEFHSAHFQFQTIWDEMERFKHKFIDSNFSNRDFKIGYRKLETFFFITPKPQINAFLYTTLREQFMHKISWKNNENFWS